MGRSMRKIVVLALAASVLASCGATERLRSKKGLFFDGHQFRTRAEQVGEEHEEFAVSVFRASQSVAGAREAGRHAAVTYCIKRYGRSEIDWAAGQGPDDKALPRRIVDDTLGLRGRCKGWS